MMCKHLLALLHVKIMSGFTQELSRQYIPLILFAHFDTYIFFGLKQARWLIFPRFKQENYTQYLRASFLCLVWIHHVLFACVHEGILSREYTICQEKIKCFHVTLKLACWGTTTKLRQPVKKIIYGKIFPLISTVTSKYLCVMCVLFTSLRMQIIFCKDDQSQKYNC